MTFHNNQQFTIKDQQFTTNDQQLIIKDQRFTTKDQQLTTNEQQFTAKDQKFTAKDQQFTTNDQQFTTNDQQFTTLKKAQKDIKKLQQFTTGINDRESAGPHSGAWWCKSCYRSNLNEKYCKTGQISSNCVVWYDWKNSFYCLKRVEMKIRPNKIN